MLPKERIEAVFRGEEADRTPVIGGWIACTEHICALAEATVDQFWDDPVSVSVRAYEKLNCDGLVGIHIPLRRDDFRIIDKDTYINSTQGMMIEEVVQHIDRMPTAREYEASFDFEHNYSLLRNDILTTQAKCGDIVYMPAQWSAGAKANWYGNFGFENFFLLVGLYPEYAVKLFEIGGAMGRCQSMLVAKAVKEGIYPHAVLFGEDICDQRGPMIPPDFIEKYYMPQLAYGIEPLLEVGCKPVWHSDGNVLPLVDMLIDVGIQGFQGFQPECGMTLDLMIQKRTREGKPLLIFGPLSVTTELPVETPEQIRDKVHEAIRKCRGNADLALFTSNTINPDVPLENVIAMHEAVIF